MKQELLVLHELETMFPPLSKEEYEGLKADIAQNGILSPVVVWNSIIVDGHHRVKVAKELDIEVSTVELEFDSIDDARIWALQHQKNRRNLPAYLFGEIALQMKPELEARAKKRMLAGVKTDPVPTLAPGSGKVRDELAGIAQVSHGTMSKIEYLAKHADEDTKDKLRRGEKGVSISGVYNDLKAQEAQTESPVEEESIAEEKPFVPDPKSTTPNVPRTMLKPEERTEVDPTLFPRNRITLRDVSKDDPDPLIGALMMNFDETYIEKLMVGLVTTLVQRSKNKLAKRIVKKIKNVTIS